MDLGLVFIAGLVVLLTAIYFWWSQKQPSESKTPLQSTQSASVTEESSTKDPTTEVKRTVTTTMTVTPAARTKGSSEVEEKPDSEDNSNSVAALQISSGPEVTRTITTFVTSVPPTDKQGSTSDTFSIEELQTSNIDVDSSGLSPSALEILRQLACEKGIDLGNNSDHSFEIRTTSINGEPETSETRNVSREVIHLDGDTSVTKTQTQVLRQVKQVTAHRTVLTSTFTLPTTNTSRDENSGERLETHVTSIRDLKPDQMPSLAEITNYVSPLKTSTTTNNATTTTTSTTVTVSTFGDGVNPAGENTGPTIEYPDSD